MFVPDQNIVIFLGTVFLFAGEYQSTSFVIESSELPFIPNHEYSGNHNGTSGNNLLPSVLIGHSNNLKSTFHYKPNAIFGSLFKKTHKYPIAVTITSNETNTVNNTTSGTSKRLKQKRRPLHRLTYSERVNSKQELRRRFLEVFQIVQFEHVACTSNSGLEGTCLHQFECQSSGGTGMGDCADGYGICCVTQFFCNGNSAATMGWFNNPEFPTPSSERLSCAFTLDKASEDITQIRLDFTVFELLPPSGGVCQQDQFVVSGHNINNVVPIFCGINTGQHVYIEVGDVEGPVYFALQTVSSESRLFSIKITQLTQKDELAAPPGCLQYFKEPQGYLESYNYRDSSEIDITLTPSYLNNLNYAMCIKREPKTCSITYSNEDEIQIVNYDLDGLPIIPPDQAGVEIFNCPSDWLLIASTRICGYRLNDGSVIEDFTLNAPITDTNAGPIIVWFRSDEGYVGRGFKLSYEQILCQDSNTS